MKHGRADYDKRIQDSAGLIPEHEPVLLIRAQDKYAPQVAHFYAGLLLRDGKVEGWRRAMKQAAHITFWQEDWPERVKSPDVDPKGEYDRLALPPGITNRVMWERVKEVLQLSLSPKTKLERIGDLVGQILATEDGRAT